MILLNLLILLSSSVNLSFTSRQSLGNSPYVTNDFTRPQIGKQLTAPDAYLETVYQCSNDFFMPTFGTDTLNNLQQYGFSQTAQNNTSGSRTQQQQQRSSKGVAK